MKAKGLVPLLTLMGAMTALSIDIYLPSMPAIAHELVSPMSKVQLSLSLFLLSFSCGQLLYGPLSDRFGRRVPLLTGLLIYFIANLLCAAAPTVNLLLAGRFLQGLGACCGAVSCIAITRDLFSGREMTKILAQMATAISLAPIMAPMIGAWLDKHFGWRSSFIFLAVAGSILLLLCWRYLPETGKPGQKVRSGYASILRHAGFREYTLLNGFSFAALFAFISTASPILMGHFGLSSQNFGMLFASNALMFMLGSHVAGRMAAKTSLPFMALLGSGLISSGGLLMAVASAWHSPFSLLLPMYLVTLGVGLAMPAGTSGALAPFGQNAGGASGLQGFIRFALAAVTGAILSALPISALTLACTVTLCGLACLLFSSKRAIGERQPLGQVLA